MQPNITPTRKSFWTSSVLTTIAFPPLKAAARLLLIVALMVSIGAHWGVLQVAAWANMARIYTAEKGLVEGLKETFDGQHPCSMCNKLKDVRDGESQKDLPVNIGGQSDLTKWLGMEPTILLPQLSWHEAGLVVPCGAPAAHLQPWDVSPPVPPPRMAA